MPIIADPGLVSEWRGGDSPVWAPLAVWLFLHLQSDSHALHISHHSSHHIRRCSSQESQIRSPLLHRQHSHVSLILPGGHGQSLEQLGPNPGVSQETLSSLEGQNWPEKNHRRVSGERKSPGGWVEYWTVILVTSQCQAAYIVIPITVAIILLIYYLYFQT